MSAGRTEQPLDTADAQSGPVGVAQSADPEARARALAEVARRQHAPLVRFLTLRTGSVEEARDIVQDAYVKVLAAETRDSIKSLVNYLWRCVLNRLTDRRRELAVRERFAQAEQAGAQQIAPSAETVADARQRLEVIERALEELPPRCVNAFILRVLHGLPFDDAGRQMGISGRMVKIYVARALAHMQACLEEYDSPGDSA